MIKLIMFDLGNVLLKTNNNENLNYDTVGKMLSSLSYESVFDSVFKVQLNKLCKDYNIDEYFLKERLNNYFKQTNQINMTESEIQSLSIKYKLGIASNFISNIKVVLEPILKYFDLICISGAMEVEKPNPEFFRRLKNEAYYQEIFPREILFIDDKMENLQAASEFGIKTLHYNNKEENEKSLFECINDFIDKLEKSEDKIVDDNKRINTVLNNMAKRPKNILKAKLERQREATYTNLEVDLRPKVDPAEKEHPIDEFATVGALPVFNTYGFKPTEPQRPPLEALKELESEDTLFQEEMLMSLSNIEVPFQKDDLYPVYILLSYGKTQMGRVIKKFTNEPYSHGAIAFDSKLNSLYSFTKEGFVHENIRDKKTYGAKEDYKYSLYTVFVNSSQIKLMDKALSFFITNKDKLSYSIKGCINNFFKKETHDKDKFFCSQFVAEIIKSGNEKIIKKDPSLYTPYDLKKIKNCFFIQKGYLKNYKFNKTEERVNLIKSKLGDINLTESLSDYIRFNKNNDLIIKYKRTNFKEEYNKSHKLLKIFAKTNDLESMKEELAKLWSYYLIIEEIYIQRAKEHPKIRETKQYKDAVIAKAFILGDIQEYLTFIKRKEPKFDFATYYMDSQYNKDTITITQNDMKKIADLIKIII